jgi:hemoglobin
MHIFEMRARVTEADIRRLVHGFYDSVQTDALLGPVFAARIAAGEWPAHLDKMCSFWSTILLGTGRYLGNPMLVHHGIPGLTPDHFDRWLGLFAVVLGEVFDRETASAIHGRAARMAERLGAARPD